MCRFRLTRYVLGMFLFACHTPVRRLCVEVMHTRCGHVLSSLTINWTLEVMGSEESRFRFTVFQCNGTLGKKTSADKVMHPSCRLIWSGVGSVILGKDQQHFVIKVWSQLSSWIVIQLIRGNPDSPSSWWEDASLFRASLLSQLSSVNLAQRWDQTVRTPLYPGHPRHHATLTWTFKHLAAFIGHPVMLNGV